MKYIKILSCIFLVGLLGGCQTTDAMHEDVSNLTSGNMPLSGMTSGTAEGLLESPCPQVEIVDDLSSISDFSDPQKQAKNQLISRVDLKSAESSCKLASKSVTVDLKLIFEGKLGPKGRQNASDKPFFSYPFFIAVTSPGGNIMAKEIFAASMTYGAKEDTHAYFEKLRQIIPIKNKDLANRYRILIGFQVTPDQLAYNREHMVPVAGATKAAQKHKPDVK